MLKELIVLTLIGPNATEGERADLAKNLPDLRALGICWLIGFLLWALL